LTATSDRGRSSTATTDRVLGRATVLGGSRGGKYPHGNSLLVAGREETIVIDPSLALLERRTRPHADRVLNSHCHEDHVAGNHLYTDAPWSLHEADAPGIRSIEGMMAIYGMSPVAAAAFEEAVRREFHYVPRPDAESFRDGHVFDLGAASVRVIHAPGHTRGHCAFLVEPDGVLYLGDIDLTSFGPYYGDAWSSLVDFERSLALVRGIEARWYATFHHVGVLEGRDAFVERLDRYAAVIASREARLLAYLSEPRSLDQIARHRFVYRPGDAMPFAEDVERRSMGQHLERLVADGRVEEIEPGRYRTRA
jgi:glyoxylase-like metal-dependent hydrolase (beta-lactamase superfamily II)